MWFQFLQKIVRFIDPKLEKYRERKPRAAKKESPFTPQTIAEFIGVIRRTPTTVLSKTDRARISAVMSFDDKIVADLMIPRSKMTFVKSSEVLGPLVLDKLYKSGFTHFPVVDGRERVIGILHTEALNALEIRDTDRADKYLDKAVCYLHATDSLVDAVSEVKRTGVPFFLVRDGSEGLVGCFTVNALLDYLTASTS